jgi:hypothetical protein
MSQSLRFRARRPIAAGFLTAAIATLLVGGGFASASGGSKPPAIAVDLQANLEGVTQTWAIDAGGAPVLVYQLDATNPVNPGGISIIRGGNHKIEGSQLELGRIVGDADGSIAVQYRAGMQSHTRVIKADNSLAFDVYRPVHRHAGIATDGDGGAYLVTHSSYKPPGSAIADQTKHTTVHYSPTGTVLWEVAQPPVPSPYSVPQHRSAAAKSSLGVFVGYAVDGRSDQPKPIVLHQAKADGATLFVQDALKGPKLSAGQIVLGEVGTGELEAFVEHVVAASDGSVLAVLHNHGHDQWVIRLDASGQQTATFVCDGHAMPIQPNEIACIDTVSGYETFEFSRYGISGGNLERTVDAWQAPKKAGRTWGSIAGLPGRQLLVGTRENDELHLVLLSKTGVVMKDYDTNSDRRLAEIGANAGKWIGAGTSSVMKGTYSLGGALPTTSAQKPIPAGVKKIPRAL